MRKVLCALALAALALPARGAVIAFDAASTNVTTGTSWSHTISGANPILVVGCEDNTAASPATFNGVTMTHILQTVFTNASGWVVDTYYMLAPPTGTHTVDCHGNASIRGAAVSYTNVLGLRAGAYGTGQTATTTMNATMTTAFANSWVIGVFDSINVGVTAGQANQRASDQNTLIFYDSTAPIVTPGSYTVSGAVSPGGAYDGVALELTLNASGGSSTVVRHRVVMR